MNQPQVTKVMLMIHCPVTRLWVWTGLAMTREIFEAEWFDSVLACRECGTDHRWTKHDVVLQGYF